MKRNLVVDGLRGLAALAVVLEHLVLLLMWRDGVRTKSDSPWEALVSDIVIPPAVVAVWVFFVISGFVLNSALDRRTYPRFLAGRLIRLWPVCVMTVCLGFVLQNIAWLNLPYLGQIPISRLLEEVFMLPAEYLSNPPLWTLAIEVRMAPLWPLIIWLARHRFGLPIAGMIAVSTYFWPPIAFMRFLPLFVFGGMLARQPLQQGMRMVCILLKAPLAQILGRYSYSLYAVHLPMLAAAIRVVDLLTHHILPGWLTVVLTLPFLAMATALCYWLVEVPSIRLSHRLSKPHDIKSIDADSIPGFQSRPCTSRLIS